MSEENKTEGFGDYHPQAAAYGPYNDAMAAWRNQVRAMQDEGSIPAQEQVAPTAEEEPQKPAEDVRNVGGTQEQSTPSTEPQGDAEGAQDGTAKEGDPESAEQTMAERDEADEPDAQADEEPKEVYDPSAHTAPDVLDYLKGVGEDEAKRVLESEEAGKNRKGITSLKDDVLAKARENDETGSGSTTA